MTRSRARRWTGTAVAAVAALVALFAVGVTAEAQEVVRGRLHIIWDGAARGEEAEYFVVPLDGSAATRLRVSRAREASGELLALDRRLVEVQIAAAVRAADSPAGVASADLVSIAAAEPVARDGQSLIGATGPPQTLDFVTILCRFVGDPTVPVTVPEVATVHGATYPGLRYHYQEMSGIPGVMAGSRVVGWYDLPQPRSWYVTGNVNTNYGMLVNDCASLAQTDVDFDLYHGINLQFSSGLSPRPTAPYDTLSFGGSWTLRLDGTLRSWGVTWLSGLHARNYVVVHHEVGHAAGWPHSSGAYGLEYDSSWDLMSRGYLRFESDWGWLGIHTISSHKDAVGWLPPERVFEPEPASVTTVRIARSAMPPPDGYLMARLPRTDGGWYSVEARLPAGLDTPLPGSAILIHRVSSGTRSYVVDATDNGDPNDAGAMWTVGEEFVDNGAGARVRVDAAAADGFDVTITRGWEVGVTILGSGSVASSALGVPEQVCDVSCSRLFGQYGATITLQAAAGPAAAFLGWSGDCVGTGECRFPLTGTATVTARFGTTPVFLTTSVDDGTMGKYYTDSLEIDTGGGAPVWSVVAGTLPPGLVIGTANGRIVGYPSAPGTFNFTVRVTSGPFQVEQAASIEIDKPVLPHDAVIQALLGTSTLTTDELKFLDLLGNANGLFDVGDVRAWLVDASYLTPAQRAGARALLAPARRAP